MGSVGHARVSTADQNSDLQHSASSAAGCHRIFTDHGVNGWLGSPRELDKMLEHLRDGNEVAVWKLDLLGRTIRNLLTLIDDLERRGVHLRSSVTEDISATGPMGRAMLTFISAFAQLERDPLVERTKAGTAAAAEHGRKAGRREVAADHAKVKRARDVNGSGLTPADIGKINGDSRATLYRYLRMESNEVI